ncbi:hypothetical protein Vafri_15181 [Volvox africanus]|uniref:Uncharacterized protein n=1 Tax=Volvox africanus TaxID=51714 RepID=A0A8J4BFV0_9CHLO|nr:hypothetical protein Vafri_15181 [Volvox africanus]
MKKWLSCFPCATDKVLKQQNQRCPPEGTLSRGSDYCSTFPVSRPRNSDLIIKHTSKLELALQYGRSTDAVLVLAWPRADALDPNTDGTLCELEPVYCNLSAVKMLGLPVSALSDEETYEVAREVLSVIGELEPALLQDSREHLRRVLSRDLTRHINPHITSLKNPQISSPQALPTRLNEHAQGAAAVSCYPSISQSAPVPMAVSIPRPWKHVVFESVMYDSMSTVHANDVAQQSPTMNDSNLQRPVLQSRRSLLSRVTTSQTGMEANNFQPKSSKYQAPDDSNTPHGCMAVPAVILYFQIHLQRPSQPSSYPQSPDTEGILPETTGSVWPFSPFSALSADSSIHGVMNSAVLSAPQSNAMTFPPPSCDSSLHPPAETGLPDAAACERSTRRAGNNTTGRGPGPGMQQLHRQHSRTSRITQQHQPSLSRRGGSIWPAAARLAERYKLAASAPADGNNGEVATSSASIIAAADASRSGEGFRAALVGAAAAAEMTSATVVTAGEEGSLLETSFLRHHCSSSLSKSIADYFREREGMVLSGLTPVVTAFGGPGCMEVLYQNVTSILYFGLRAQPKTNSNGCAVTKAQEGASSSGSSTLAELFSFEPSKLERLLNDVLSEGRVWRGIVQVPATCHPRLTRLQRAQQAMTNPTTKLISSGAPSSTARHTTTHYSSSLIQTVTHLPISTAVPAPMNHPEPVTQQQSSALPHVSIGVQMSKSSPHLQGSHTAIAHAMSLKAAAAAATPALTPAVEYAGSIIDTYSNILSTVDGITLATAMATDDVDPLKKALGNSEIDPLVGHQLVVSWFSRCARCCHAAAVWTRPLPHGVF